MIFPITILLYTCWVWNLIYVELFDVKNTEFYVYRYIFHVWVVTLEITTEILFIYYYFFFITALIFHQIFFCFSATECASRQTCFSYSTVGNYTKKTTSERQRFKLFFIFILFCKLTSVEMNFKLYFFISSTVYFGGGMKGLWL